MESSSMVGACLSPESTVTSLLSSSGHLGSSLVVPEHNTTFRYKHKLYDSASAALNAYIADFHSSHPREKVLTGNLNVSHRFPSTLGTPRVTTLKNKDVLREHLTDRELDILSLPDSSLNHSVHRDRVSMTTDELLSIPYDGSMPVTHTSAFIQGLFSSSGAAEPCLPPSRPANRTCRRSHSMHTIPEVKQQGVPPTRTPRSFRSRRAAEAMLQAEPPHMLARPERREPSSSLHLPHWLTSNKSDIDGSEVSVPDLKYPPWIHCCDVSRPPVPTETLLWDHPAPGPRAPSWVSELDDEDDPEHTNSQAGSQRTLRDLRLQLAQQISLLAAERTDSSVKEKLFRDNRMESLLRKADQVLNSLSRGCGAAEPPADPAERSSRPITPEPVTPPDTQELLCLSSSRYQQEPLGSPAGGTTAPPNDGVLQACSSHHGNGVLKQPGPAEALKQVLFRLQAVEAELQHRQQQKASVCPAVEVPEQQKAEAELGRSPDGLSLQRALHLLTNLKVLVEEPRKKDEEEEVEKDEDEGRYSSSSADGFTCAEQKPS